MEETKDISQIKGIFRRRKKPFILSFIPILVIGAIIAYALPSTYLSKSTILIENQLIPTEYVQTTITGFVEERLQVINQQVMSRSRLMEIINRFNLYTDMKERYTSEEIIEKMRADIKLRTISADVMDRRTGRPTAATIAFSLSYEGKNPSMVQKVANVLASLYLEMNLKSREERASTTTDFFEQELEGLRAQINDYQTRISTFKSAHLGELPEFSSVNLQAVARLENELSQIRMQIGSLKERKILLQGQMAAVDPLKAIITEEGKAVMNPSDRLQYLRLQLLTLKGSLSEKHPDVKKLKKEIWELEAETGAEEDPLEKVQRLAALEADLTAAKAEKGPKHPDVIRLEREVEALTRDLEREPAGAVKKAYAEERPDNPAYISLKTQLASADLEIQALIDREGRVRAQIEQYRRKIEAAPLVEREYTRMLQDMSSAQNKYNELMSKFMEAKVAQGMEETQRGERFTIIDPAQLPEKAYKPNRLAIVLIAFVLALGGGVGMAALTEALDPSVKSVEQLAALTGVPVLSAIDFMQSAEERRKGRLKVVFWAVIVLALIALGIFLFDQYVMPLEVFWVKVQRRLIKMGLSQFAG